MRGTRAQIPRYSTCTHPRYVDVSIVGVTRQQRARRIFRRAFFLRRARLATKALHPGFLVHVATQSVRPGEVGNLRERRAERDRDLATILELDVAPLGVFDLDRDAVVGDEDFHG